MSKILSYRKFPTHDALGTAIRLNVCVPHKVYMENLIPHVMVLEGGALGRGLGHE